MFFCFFSGLWIEKATATGVQNEHEGFPWEAGGRGEQIVEPGMKDEGPHREQCCCRSMLSGPRVREGLLSPVHLFSSPATTGGLCWPESATSGAQTGTQRLSAIVVANTPTWLECAQQLRMSC
ncbi:uncharacterized protein AAES06_023946 isoform 1-T1 [Glossophaga mutica]